MENKQQTAIDFLITELINLTGVNINLDEPIILKAKQMEKEQIRNAIKYESNLCGCGAFMCDCED